MEIKILIIFLISNIITTILTFEITKNTQEETVKQMINSVNFMTDNKEE